MTHEFDVIVIGAGHAGLEASLAAARLGKKTALITINTDHIVYISCNPSIGGLGKSHMVKEINALGGEMARLADRSSVQYKMLNRSKGLAVWSLRSQIDKYLYSKNATQVAEATANLEIVQDRVDELLVEASGGQKKVKGVRGERGVEYLAPCVILCTGTFLGGKLYIGDYKTTGGRLGELSSTKLSDSLKSFDFEIARLKTGTPARVHADSIDFSKLEEVWGDEEIFSKPLSFTDDPTLNQNPQLPCYVTYTNEQTHKIIRDNLHRSPLYGGKIEGNGPRYCPSIEDKVYRFADKTRHQLYLEPEGIESKSYYVNGLSSSMPEDVQHEFIVTVPGLEKVKIIKPAYAVEYDYIVPTHLTHHLESKHCEGLFFAGQVNGTSGYEEAAGQGLVAGVNAVRKLDDKPPLVLGRDESYIGVMIDDLILKGVKEPYRMFTSRAEYRLTLRSDNADERLLAKGHEVGLVNDKRMASFIENSEREARLDKLFHETKLLPEEVRPCLRATLQDDGENQEELSEKKLEKKPIAYYCKRSDLDFDKLVEVIVEVVRKSMEEEDSAMIMKVAADIKYAGYAARQSHLKSQMEKKRAIKIASDFDYSKLMGLKQEAREKLDLIRPESLDQVFRIEGLSYSDAQIIYYHLIKAKKESKNSEAK